MAPIREAGENVREGEILDLVPVPEEDLGEPPHTHRYHHVYDDDTGEKLRDLLPESAGDRLRRGERCHPECEGGRGASPTAVVREEKRRDERGQPEQRLVVREPAREEGRTQDGHR